MPKILLPSTPYSVLRTPHSTSGFTLVELIVVIAILVLVAGTGVAGIRALATREDLPSASAAVRTILRRARAAAVEGGGAIVEVDAAPGRAVLSTWDVVGTWHFEDGDGDSATAIGARGQTILLLDGVGRTAGRIGRGLLLGSAMNKEGVPEWSMAYSALPGISRARGLRFECWIEDQGTAQGRLFGRGDSFALDLPGNGGLVAYANVGAAGASPEAGDGRNGIGTGDVALVPWRWTHLSYVYDGLRMAIHIDGLEVGSRELRGDLVPETAPPAARGIGTFRVDEIRVAALLADETAALPARVQVREGAVLRFGRDGALDRRVHAAPVRIDLRDKAEGGGSETIEVDLSGRIAPRGR